MKTRRSGFTLIELSIVLIIIGLIIGGVMKGTDMINSAKTKKVYTTWIKGWQIAVNSYQDRTGQLLGDTTTNGGTAAATALDGAFDNVVLNTSAASATGVQAQLRKAGLDVPVTNTGGGPLTAPDGATYTLEGKDRSGVSAMTLAYRSFSNANRNVIEITNVPNDVAMTIDTMVDGVADAGLGNCRSGAASTAGTTSAWPASNAAVSVVRIAI